MISELDEIIHAPNRLAICSMLSVVKSMEFAAIRDELNVSDSVASKQLKILLDAGYVNFVSKTSEQSKRPRTWVSLSDTGASAFAAYVKKMQSLIAR